MTASAEKVVVKVAANQAVMAAVAVAMAAVASAATAQPAKSARHVKVDAVVKAESKAVKAKPVPHVLNAVNVQNAVSAQSAVNAQSVENAVSAASVQTVTARPEKAAVMAAQARAAKTWPKASARTA